MGRPSLYRSEYAKQALKICRLGATDAEMADFFEVSVTTIRNWQSEHPEFAAAVKPGKDEADDRIERSLYHRALGYTFEAEKVFQFQGQVIRAPIREHVPPDTTACIFWLKNRRKADWRDRTEQVSGTPDEFARMTEAELDAEIERLNREIGYVQVAEVPAGRAIAPPADTPTKPTAARRTKAVH